MAVQTSYASAQAVAYAGDKYDLNQDFVDSAVNTDAASIPFGVFVAIDPADDEGALLTTASGDVLKGVVVKADHYARAWTDAEGNVHGDLDETGLVPDTQMSTMYRGRIYVKAEHNFSKGDPLYVRYSANGGNTQLGAVSNTSDSGKNRLVAGHWLTTGLAGDIAAIDFDCVGVPS